MSANGDFAILMGDFLTLNQQKLPFKAVIFNKGSLGFVELEMKSPGLIETGIALDNPDFAATRKRLGIERCL